MNTKKIERRMTLIIIGTYAFLNLLILIIWLGAKSSYPDKDVGFINTLLAPIAFILWLIFRALIRKSEKYEEPSSMKKMEQQLIVIIVGISVFFNLLILVIWIRCKTPYPNKDVFLINALLVPTAFILWLIFRRVIRKRY